MRRIILFFVILISSISLYSQEIIWEKRISLDDTSSFYGANLQIKNDSSIYICGGVDFPNPEMGYSSSFIARLDIAGNVKWHHVFRKSNPIWPSLVHLDEESISFVGQYLITWYGGFFLGWVPFVSRYDVNGNLLFENFDSTNFEYMAKFQSSDFLVNSDNQILMTTHPKLEDTLQISVFDSDGYFFYGKIIDAADKKGKKILSKKILFDSNKYYITGIDVQPSNKLPNTGLPFLLILNRYFEKQEKIYFQNYGANESNIDISQNSVKELLMLNRLSILSDTSSKQNILRSINLKTNKFKEVLFGTSKSDYMNCLVVDKNDNILCFGYKMYDYYDKESVDSFRIIKFSKELDIIWEMTWCHSEGLRRSIRDVKVDNNNDIFIIGRDGDSIYLAKIKDLTVDVPNASKASDIEISPNPATDYIEINVPPLERWSGGVSVKIYDVLGIEHPATAWHPSTEGNVRIDISALPKGVYFVSVGGQMYKFIKI